VESPGCVTLRTSLVGHELTGRRGLLEWFLAQEGRARGFARAIFSGFPTVELARIVAERVVPNETLQGLYHVASSPIAKLELLRLVAAQYGKTIQLEPDQDLVCDRSLDASRFCQATGYEPPDWPALVAQMHAHFCDSPWYKARASRA
jgi:dTDP-4-dehydrorhamnose reductase